MRVWASCCQFNNRYVYIFGGNLQDDKIEVLDVTLENINSKCDIIDFNINYHIPYGPSH